MVIKILYAVWILYTIGATALLGAVALIVCFSLSRKKARKNILASLRVRSSDQ
jgi:hypothetical protein